MNPSPEAGAPEKIRVLRIQSRICIGGPALNTLLVSSNLPKERFSVLTVGGRLLEDERTMEPFAHDRGAPMHLLEEMGRSIHWNDDLRALRKLVKLMRLFRPHIVHTHTAKAGALGRVAAFIARVPVRMHTFHGHVFHGYFSPLKSKLAVLIERCLAMLSHAIIAISPRQYEDLVDVYGAVPAKKCHVVRLGFELDKIAGGTPGVFRDQWQLAPQTKLVGILARLVPIKNHQLLIEAIAVWHRRFPHVGPDQVRFLIIGDGELRPQLERRVAELGIADWVLFTGWQRDTPSIYADLDLNVLVSKNEGTPVTLIEGLACGIPVLSTDVGGIRDFADESHGTIVPKDISPEGLADALAAFLAEPSRLQRLDESVSRRIRETFHVDRLVSDIDALYSRLLQARR
ncbi:glycosyltransferase [Acanthopleuribacter pedis]|uniref:Glycosyltransferase n=1 Tax=Acanthopleuribacter pedis TaxID=442870 RepID=A0A8J7Q851_9BACT|nr:glycosyltransferase [Acanthopleuribacter pedis]MBO1319164.1 glycosyltransferase [Acanthopleuribacter pedis]